MAPHATAQISDVTLACLNLLPEETTSSHALILPLILPLRLAFHLGRLWRSRSRLLLMSRELVGKGTKAGSG
jgi:hypothetical protein